MAKCKRFMVDQDIKKKVMVECSALNKTLILPSLRIRRRESEKNARAGICGEKL